MLIKVPIKASGSVWGSSSSSMMPGTWRPARNRAEIDQPKYAAGEAVFDQSTCEVNKYCKYQQLKQYKTCNNAWNKNNISALLWLCYWSHLRIEWQQPNHQRIQSDILNFLHLKWPKSDQFPAIKEQLDAEVWQGKEHCLGSICSTSSMIDGSLTTVWEGNWTSSPKQQSI